jgi:hypothetical protein
VRVRRDATDNVVRGAFNTWFPLSRSSLDEVREAQCLDNTIKEDNRVVMHNDNIPVILMV